MKSTISVGSANPDRYRNRLSGYDAMIRSGSDSADYKDGNDQCYDMSDFTRKERVESKLC